VTPATIDILFTKVQRKNKYPTKVLSVELQKPNTRTYTQIEGERERERERERDVKFLLTKLDKD